MSLKIPFDFGMSSKVRLRELQANGVVVGLMHDVSGNQYRVIYYINNERRDQWLFRHELEESL